MNIGSILTYCSANCSKIFFNNLLIDIDHLSGYIASLIFTASYNSIFHLREYTIRWMIVRIYITLLNIILGRFNINVDYSLQLKKKCKMITAVEITQNSKFVHFLCYHFLILLIFYAKLPLLT